MKLLCSGCSSALHMRNTLRAAPVRKSLVLPLGYQYPALSESATALGFRVYSWQLQQLRYLRQLPSAGNKAGN
jgi:hypothetical protein